MLTAQVGPGLNPDFHSGSYQFKEKSMMRCNDALAGSQLAEVSPTLSS